MQYFDYESTAHEARITEEELTAIIEIMRKEFPSDEMMQELHILRACLAIKDGHARIEDILSSQVA